MLVRSLDGTVSMSGSRVWVGIPNSGEFRYRVDPGYGGTLSATWAEAEDEGGRTGRVILEVPDGHGEHDELVITSPRTIRVSEDGAVSLTLSEYVQVSGALSAIPAMLGELEARVAALEKTVAAHPMVALNPENVTISDEGTGPSGEEG